MNFKTISKKTFLLMLLMATFLPRQAKAQETLTVCDGTATSQYIPMYGNYFDDYTKSECIIPASELTDMEGGTITAITFYAETVGNRNWDNTNQKVFLKEVSNTTLSGSYSGMEGATIVFDGLLTMPTTSSDGYTITFSKEYIYNGGNLLIGVYNDDDGSYNNVKWYGTSNLSSGVSAFGYNGSSLDNVTYTAQSFLPKTTFTYEPASTGGCTKPKQFNASNITAHTATLTWTAGDDGQSNWDVYVTTDATIVPDENTTPTYQVTECSKELSDLTAQTTYYVYVRAVCATDDKSKWANKTFATTREALTVDSNNPYSQNFENNNDWGFANGTLTNKWCWGSATNNGGQKSIYVSKDGGTTYEYAHGNTAIYASKLFNFAQGTYTFFFDWNAKGESTYDYLRVALAPGDVEFSAGTNLYPGVGTTTLPNNWIALDGGSKLNLSDGWQNQSAEASVSGTYTMVFIWRNDISGGTTIPAAIDNISISFMTCPRPTNLTASNITGRTATLSWTENSTATNWVLQYATNNSFTEDLVETNVSETASKNLTGLSPETKYYARVKSVLGNQESSWSDVKDFTTTATCVKPTSITANNITAYTATIGWTNGEEGQGAWEISYSTSSQSNPENGTVILVTTNPYTLNGLTPETPYYVYVRADCGSEDGKSAWSSYKYLTTLATCVKPTGLTANNVTSSTATITWAAGETGQDAWNLQYKKSSDSEWQTVAVTTTSYNLTNLSPVTTYNVRVQADCGEGDMSQWTSNTSFTTECAALTLPYTYGFEENLQTTSPYNSSNPFPKCWSRVAYQSGNYGNYTYYPYVFTATTSQPYAHGGNGANSYSGHSLRFYQTSSSTNECAVLPEISDDYEMNQLQIRFWAAVQSSRGTLSIGIMESPSNASTFTSIQEVTVSNTYNSGFQEFTVPFSTYTGNGRYIAFMCGTGNNYAYFLIDDVTIEEIPSCQIPTNLEATVNSATETLFTWTAGLSETDWELEVTADNNGISQTISVSDTPTYTLSTTRATAYTVRVRANCGEGDFSDWSNPISFTSDCGVLVVDATHSFLEDFESTDASDFPPICWQKFHYQMSGNTNSYWYLNYNNGLDSGAAYSSWNEGYAFLVMPQMHIDGDATLSFDYLIGTGNYNESCSVVVSTNGMTFGDFNTTIWEGNGPTSGKASETVSLSDYDGQDLYIAFKYKGASAEGCSWYVDNVKIYVTSPVHIKEITKYTEGNNDHYYLIASPIGEVNPENVGSMLENTYDLYYFDQANELEWINYKAGQNSNNSGFNLEPGKGYLYANSDDVKLTFTGTPYSGNGEVTLAYDQEASFPGWNLVGNPFAETAYIDRPFYVMNSDGSEIIAAAEAEQNSIAAMEGVFVRASEDGETMTFSTNKVVQQSQQIVVDVTRNRGIAIDRAIVRFGEGHTLPKFQINPGCTKVYIPMNGQDYAVVRSESMDEIPINFKTEENGTYSINVDADNVKMNYLHLIDNLTGADIDLLENPCYTFEAKTTDYASRFKLVFATHDSSTNDNNFAFIDASGNIIVNGEGILQMMDMTGRVIRSTDGVGTVSTGGMTSGVYVLRLINGNEVKTQKIVVR